MPNPKKSTGTLTSMSSKINVTPEGATPKPYPKVRSKSIDRNGEEITEIRDSTKKMLFSGKTSHPKTKETIQSFKKDSVGYSKSADYEAKDFNNKKAYENAARFVGKKK